MATTSGGGKGPRRPVMPFVAYAIVLAVLGAAGIALWARERGGPPGVPASDRASPAISKAAPPEPAHAAQGLKLPPRPGGKARRPRRPGRSLRCRRRRRKARRATAPATHGGRGGGDARAAEEPVQRRCRPLAHRQDGAGQGHSDSPARSRPLWRHHVWDGRSGDPRGDQQVPTRGRRGRNRRAQRDAVRVSSRRGALRLETGQGRAPARPQDVGQGRGGVRIAIDPTRREVSC